MLRNLDLISNVHNSGNIMTRYQITRINKFISIKYQFHSYNSQGTDPQELRLQNAKVTNEELGLGIYRESKFARDVYVMNIKFARTSSSAELVVSHNSSLSNFNPLNLNTINTYPILI